MKKLAVITSHPIQYNAPLFRQLALNGAIAIRVFYTWGQARDQVFDPGFEKVRQWDIPLLEGYAYEFVDNVAKDPGSHHFSGIDNPSLIDRINEYDPDALLVFGWSFKSHLKVLRHFSGKKKIIFRGDSTLLDEAPGFSVKKLIRRIVLTWVYKHIDIALYVGTANKAYYLRHGLKPAQLVFAPHAIDNTRFGSNERKNREEAAMLRSQLNIGATDIVFLFAGKLEPKKDPEILVQAFTNLHEKNTQLVLVGNGEIENELRAQTVSNPNIHFLGFQNQTQMPAIYHVCDVFVLPSKGPNETWGLAVNEAMACSKPVIVSNRCGCAADLVKEGENGWIFKSGDQHQLEGILQKAVSQKQQLPVWGQRSSQIISNWSFAEICKSIEKILLS